MGACCPALTGTFSLHCQHYRAPRQNLGQLHTVNYCLKCGPPCLAWQRAKPLPHLSRDDTTQSDLGAPRYAKG